jgi:methionyl-tRNA formyltransferase
VGIIREGHEYRRVATEPRTGLRVLLLSSDDPHHDYLHYLLSQNCHLVGVIVEPGRAQQARLWRRRRFLDWYCRYRSTLRQRLTGRRRYRRRYFAAIARQPISGVSVQVVDWINSDRAVEYVRQARPDITVVCGTTLLSPRLLRECGLAINVHGGCLPEYRGNHCIFFAYAQRDFHHIGATLHVVTAELDAGDIIETVRPEIYPHDNDEHLYCRSVHKAMVRLIELLRDLETDEGRISPRAQGGVGRMYRHRDRKLRRDLTVWMRRRLGLHPVPHLEVV